VCDFRDGRRSVRRRCSNQSHRRAGLLCLRRQRGWRVSFVYDLVAGQLMSRNSLRFADGARAIRSAEHAIESRNAIQAFSAATSIDRMTDQTRVVETVEVTLTSCELRKTSTCHTPRRLQSRWVDCKYVYRSRVFAPYAGWRYTDVACIQKRLRGWKKKKTVSHSVTVSYSVYEFLCL